METQTEKTWVVKVQMSVESFVTYDSTGGYDTKHDAMRRAVKVWEQNPHYHKVWVEYE